jgi:hypothetical protein
MLLFAAVGVVLLIACVNVSQLLLAARGRSREGDRPARRARRQPRGGDAATDGRGTAAAIVASMVGLGLGRLAIAGLAWLRPPSSVPIPADLPLDPVVLLFNGAVALAVALLCGLAPALRRRARNLARTLQAGFRPRLRRRPSDPATRSWSSRWRCRSRWSRSRRCSSRACSRSAGAARLRCVKRVHAAVPAPAGEVREARGHRRFFKGTHRETSAPCRASVGGAGARGAVQRQRLARSRTPSKGKAAARSDVGAAGAVPPRDPDYFKTMRSPILKGGATSPTRDDAQTPLVAVINDTFARRAFPGEDRSARRFTTPQPRVQSPIIGVVGDAKHYTATEPPGAALRRRTTRCR